MQDNDVRGNQQDGLRLVSEASQTDVRGNVIGENMRYGVYVDSDGPFAMAGNTIWKNRTGVMLKGNPDGPVEREQHLQQQGDGRQERLTSLPQRGSSRSGVRTRARCRCTASVSTVSSIAAVTIVVPCSA